MVPLWCGWHERDQRRQLAYFETAKTGEAAALLPGTLLVLLAGFFVLAVEGLSPITTGWLLVKIILQFFVLFVCLPLLHTGLQRAYLAATRALEAGTMTDELQTVLADNVPRVFSGFITGLVVVMVVLAVLKPF